MEPEGAGDSVTAHGTLALVRRIQSLWPLHVPGTDHEISSHALCMVLASRVPRVRRVEGHFIHRHFEHSWLVLEDEPDWIIDPQPLGQPGGPVMRRTSVCSPFHSAYVARRVAGLLNASRAKVLAQEIAALQEAPRETGLAPPRDTSIEFIPPPALRQTLSLLPVAEPKRGRGSPHGGAFEDVFKRLEGIGVSVMRVDNGTITMHIPRGKEEEALGIYKDLIS